MWTFVASAAARWVMGGVAILAIVGGIYLKGRTDGTVACVASQQAQMDKMEAYVKAVRERVERNQPLDDDILRTDPFQRE